jgi:hypothetical protein
MLTRFCTLFSRWELIDTVFCENRNENRSQVLTWKRTGFENLFECTYLENRTGSLIELWSGSQSSLYHVLVPLVLLVTSCLLFSCCCYVSSHTAITFLPLLFFSLYYYSFYCYYWSPSITVLSLLVLYYSSLYYYYFFPIALILFLWLWLSSHGVALFVWWSHLIINCLIT